MRSPRFDLEPATTPLGGAETILVGIRSDVALMVVALGTGLAGLVTRASLRSGLTYAMNKPVRKAP